MEILEEQQGNASSDSDEEAGPAAEGEGGEEEGPPPGRPRSAHNHEPRRTPTAGCLTCVRAADEMEEDHITFAEIESFLNKMPAAVGCPACVGGSLHLWRPRPT